MITDPGSNGVARGNVEHLDHRASVLAPVTRLILQQAGIAPGMRVLDLGTGTGAVARLAAELVGPTGRVVGLDRAPDALEAAEQRRLADGLTNVSFVKGDVDSWVHDRDFDAVIARLVLFHLRDPAASLIRHVRSLRPGAKVIAMDLDASVARSVPATPAVVEAVEWILHGLQQIGANPTVGARLGSLLESAGLRDPTVLGFTTYHPHADADGPLLLAGIVRSLLPALDRTGRAFAAIDADGLPRRLTDELADANAVLVPPTLVGVWATVGATSVPDDSPITERLHTFDASQCWCRALKPDAAVHLAA